MKKNTILISVLAIAMLLTGCSNSNENEPADNSSSVQTSVTQPQSSSAQPPAQSETVSSHTESSTPQQSSEIPESTVTSSATPPAQSGTLSSHTQSSIPQQSSEIPKSTVSSPKQPVQSSAKPAPSQTETPSQPNESSQPETSDIKEELVYMMNIKIGENVLTATLEHNSSAEALLKLLSEKPITIRMSDYAGMEKVGTLPTSLPRNDEHIDTDACDLILYQGNQFVIYYDTNSWSLTRLGKINNMTQDKLKSILGKGDVTVTLSRVS